MKRLTTNNPSDNLSQLLNFAYAEGEHVKLAYAGMRHGADLCEYISGEAGDAGLPCAPSPDDVMEGSCIECDCVFGVLNNVAIQAAELRARLMRIEDILGEDYDLEHLREFVKAERRWIPVTERLPDEEFWKYQKELGYDKMEVLVMIKGAKTATTLYYDTDGDFVDDNGDAWLVTHWMHLPEPPKEETCQK